MRGDGQLGLVIRNPKLVVGAEGLPDGVRDTGRGSKNDTDRQVGADARTLLFNNGESLEVKPFECGAHAGILRHVTNGQGGSNGIADARQDIIDKTASNPVGQVLSGVNTGAKVVLVSLVNAGNNLFTGESTGLSARLTGNGIGALKNFLLVAP